MSTSSPPIGETGRNVVRNVVQLRKARGLSLRTLSDRLGKLGRPILPVGLSRLENEQRRVDADDLVALAHALGVNPAALLLPPGDLPPEDHPALRETRNVAARIEAVLAADAAPGQHLARSLTRALQRLRLEIDELLDQSPPR